MTSESSACLKESGSDVPWLQSVPLHGADPVPAVGQDGGGCTHIHPWGALIIDFTNLLMLGWEGAFPGAEKSV